MTYILTESYGAETYVYSPADPPKPCFSPSVVLMKPYVPFFGGFVTTLRADTCEQIANVCYSALPDTCLQRHIIYVV
jgi:hypothetical protein